MIRSSTRGIFLIVAILFSTSLILMPSNGYAEGIDVKSTGVDKTAIVSFTNDSVEDIKTFRIWLGENVNFKSFKTEKGWIGEKNPQGVIIFTSSEPIKTGESVKIGIKTDMSNPTINWKGLDQTNTIIDTGVVISTKITNIHQIPEIDPNITGEIFTESTFRIIPDKPNIGSTIRVTGEAFGASQMFDFYIDTKKIGNFVTDENGYFITTMKIPNTQTEERVNFKIKNNQGEEKTLSLRLGNIENRVTELEKIKISVNGIKNIVHRGDVLEIFGTATPGKAIITEIKNPEHKTINSRTAKVDGTGNWKLSEPINIPYDAMFGKYSITVSDGRNHILKNWVIETDKIININPTQLMFEAGEIMKFDGTAMPNEILELILEDSLGNEITSDIIEVDETGIIEFAYQSTENDDIEGTWTLIANQNGKTEFIYVGYDEMPEIPVNMKFDKVNYKSTEKAIISLIGNPTTNIKITIISPTGGILGDDIIIKLQEDGRATYELDLSGFSSGVYTAVTRLNNTQSDEKFSVGLQIGSGNIEAKLTKTNYQQGESILLLGNTNSNVLLMAVLSDPSGKDIKKIEIPSDSKGIFTEDGFRIPSTGALGTWKLKINSGSNLEVIEFDVKLAMTEGILVNVLEDLEIAGFGKNIKIEIMSTHKTSVMIEIVDPRGERADNTLSCTTTTDFKCETFWTFTKDMIPGTYTIKVDDGKSQNQTTITLN